MQCEVLHHLLQRINLMADTNETDHVAGNAAGESDQILLGPLGSGVSQGRVINLVSGRAARNLGMVQSWH